MNASRDGAARSAADPFRYLNQLSERAIGAAINVHRALGPGLLESAYGSCLAAELAFQEVPFRREVAVPLFYRGERLDCSYRLDFLVDERLIVEVKAVSGIDPVFVAQAITYLKITGHRLALLINFNVPILKQGIRRIVL